MRQGRGVNTVKGHCLHLCKCEDDSQDSSSVVEHVPAIHETLGSILNTAERRAS